MLNVTVIHGKVLIMEKHHDFLLRMIYSIEVRNDRGGLPLHLGGIWEVSN